MTISAGADISAVKDVLGHGSITSTEVYAKVALEKKIEAVMKAEYREVISLLRKGYSIRDVAKLSGKSVNTVQRVKRLLKVQSSQ